ncbi:MAG: pyruvate kinase [Deltaproteobacteria bacterium]|nr:pyruvate kinase [Deltaproteobacteria bacterium]
MKFPVRKTKIVCTIGPASRNKATLSKMIVSGMNVARLNFSHGDLAEHEQDIRRIKDLSASLGIPVSILADLPGPKIRIGKLEGGSCILEKGKTVVLTPHDQTGSSSLIPVAFAGFMESMDKGSRVFLNDGFIQLKVLRKTVDEAICRVIIGGKLLSHKGMNLPDARLNINPVTDKDLEFVRFGLASGVDMFSVSFVKSPDDIIKVKRFAELHGKEAFVVAKIERKEALERIDAILGAADALMIARGDLGVEIPIEKVPITQKQLTLKANYHAKPVITATQMLESMTANTRPTRAEVTDVANAILDGTDAVMLSEETAIGSYPVEAVRMLVKISKETEKHKGSVPSGMSIPNAIRRSLERIGVSIEDALSLDVANTLNTLKIRCVLVPTLTGSTARRISRFKGGTWIIALCLDDAVLKSLNLSYGVLPVMTDPDCSEEQMIGYLREQNLVKPNDSLLMVSAMPFGGIGRENSLKIIKLN